MCILIIMNVNGGILDNVYLDIEVRLVVPLPEEKELFQGQQVPEKIKSFYNTNEVSSFKFDRPFNRGTKDKENEFKVGYL